MPPRLRRGTSLWLDTRTVDAPRAPALRGQHDADVVVVGGGITGCAVAHQLSGTGARVVLIEALRIGRGSTAASTALLMQEPDTDFRDLARRYGTAGARGIWRMSRLAVRALIRTIQTLDAAPQVELRPSVYFTRRSDEVTRLKRELSARRNAGMSGGWLDESRLRQLTGLEAAGGILTYGNAQVDPYAACAAFARAAQAAGAALHEHTRARRIRADQTGVQIETDDGRIRASKIVIATGYATPEFRPLAGRFRLFDTYAVATPRLDPRRRAAIGLGEVMLWDTERPYHYARWTGDRRLLFGGHDHPHRRKTRPATFDRRIAELLTQLRELYPGARHIGPDYAWEGRFATTPDGLPYIGAHRRYPRHLFALGYGGNGMTFGFMAAQIIARAIQGSPRPEDALFGFHRL